MTQPETYHFSDDGRFPNSSLPLLVYRGAIPADARAMERTFRVNGWSNVWRNGIFGYHHFHSIAHEVLGIAAGEACVEFGGPGGQTVEVRAGDVVVIPAGVGTSERGPDGTPAGGRSLPWRRRTTTHGVATLTSMPRCCGTSLPWRCRPMTPCSGQRDHCSRCGLSK